MIHISFDVTELNFKKMVEGLPWPRMTLNDPKVKELITKYEITGIPRVVVLSNKGHVLSMEGRKEICLNGAKVLELW